MKAAACWQEVSLHMTALCMRVSSNRLLKGLQSCRLFAHCLRAISRLSIHTDFEVRRVKAYIAGLTILVTGLLVSLELRHSRILNSWRHVITAYFLLFLH